MTLPEQYEKDRIAGIRSDLEKYFVDISIGCPYGLPRIATYHQALFHTLDPGNMGRFLEAGYRRNGNCVYCMHCRDCRQCVPIRLQPHEFLPNRNQRRVWRKNSDVTVGVAPLAMSGENLDLLDMFLSKRFPECRSNAAEYYRGFFISSISRCFEIRYRVGDRLVGVAVIDGDEEWLNAVYFYFDPREHRRSPGTFNILYLIDFCRRHRLPLLYLGYQIDAVAAMNYKANFKPHQLLLDGSWRTVKKASES